MSDLYTVSILVNDDNGENTGHCRAVDITDPDGEMVMEIEHPDILTDGAGWRVAHTPGRVRFWRDEGEKVLPIRSYGTWVGNMNWDAFTCNECAARELARWLLSYGALITSEVIGWLSRAAETDNALLHNDYHEWLEGLKAELEAAR